LQQFRSEINQRSKVEKRSPERWYVAGWAVLGLSAGAAMFSPYGEWVGAGIGAVGVLLLIAGRSISWENSLSDKEDRWQPVFDADDSSSAASGEGSVRRPEPIEVELEERRPGINERRLMKVAGVNTVRELEELMSQPSDPEAASKSGPQNDYLEELDTEDLSQESNETVIALLAKTRAELQQRDLSPLYRKTLHEELAQYESEIYKRGLSEPSLSAQTLTPNAKDVPFVIAPRHIILPIGASCALLLLAAFSSWPYGFYQLMRVVVCVSSVYLLFESKRIGKSFWSWTMGGIALLFNPIIPVHMRRSDWQPIDFLTAMVVLVSAYFLKRR